MSKRKNGFFRMKYDGTKKEMIERNIDKHTEKINGWSIVRMERIS